MFVRGALWIQLLYLLIFSISSEIVKTWSDRQLYPAHLIPDNALNPRRSIVRRKIVLYHNFFRSKVRPSSSNMLLMSWHEGAARKAQAYAEKCRFLKHSPLEENRVPYLGTCGQNLFVSVLKTPWFFALKTWFLEYRNFTYGDPNFILKETGHYTQMSWATSHKVGCGVAFCKGGPWGQFYNYVCHYCPGGNIVGITQYPYKAGTPCEDCPDNCISNTLCLNSCPSKDHYSNCDELTQKVPDVCNQGICNATCNCPDRLYKNYPWH